MAEPKRLPGELERAILRLVQEGPRPLSALQLANLLRDEQWDPPPSLIFRAIGRLIRDGTIRKVHLARAYAPVSEATAGILFCSQCGAAREIPCTQTFDALENAAIALRFKVARIVVEVPGLCADCAG